MYEIISTVLRWAQQQQHRWLHRIGEHRNRAQTLNLLSEEERELSPSSTTALTIHLRQVYRLHLPSLRRKPAQPRKLHPTSYLDGLRGLAAFIVFLHHSTQAFLPSLRPGWASSADCLNLLSLPAIRIMYSGGAMVAIFFVISGYVLSIRPLQLAARAAKQKQDYRTGDRTDQAATRTALDAAYSNVASAVFRRGPRLMIPCLVSTFLTAILAMLGVFVEGANIGLERHYPRAETWSAQLGYWWQQSLWFVNPFAGVHGFEANTWTIPSEFKGSLLVFLTVMGLSGRSQRMRRICILLSMGYWAWYGTWDLMQFLAGVGIADWSASKDAEEKTEQANTKGHNNSVQLSVGHSVLVFIAVYLLSMPEGDENVVNSPGYVTLATVLTPEGWKNHWGPGRWWPMWGAILLIGTLDHAGSKSVFQQAFTSEFAQFLGDISFSLYLLHGITIYSVGVRILKLFTDILGTKSSVNYSVALGLTAIIVVPVLFWISEAFTEVVDKGAVNFARQMADW